MRSSTETLIVAMRVLAKDIHSEDGVANAAIAEAAERLDELEQKNLALRNEIARLNGQTMWICTCGGTDCEGQKENAALRAAFKSAVILREHEDGLDRIQKYVQKGCLLSGEVLLLMNRTAFDAARKEAQP